MKKLSVVSLLLLLTLVAAACGPTQQPFECTDPLGCVTIAPGDPVRIGYALVIAGPNESLGVDSRRGIEIAIDDHNGELLELTLLGSEIDGGSIWVYQETPIPADLQSMSIRQNALRDIWREQVNRVNIERNKTTKTLIFQGNIEWLETEVPRHSTHSE